MNRTMALLLVLTIVTALIAMAKPALSYVDVVENSWKAKAPMRVARGNLGIATVNGKVYAIGGFTKSGSSSSAGSTVGTNEEYDPATDTWVFKASMPTPRYDFAIVVYQDKIYCIGGTGGIDKNTGWSVSTLNEVYDPATDTWATDASMPNAAAKYASAVFNNKIYVIGGMSNSPQSNLNQIYDPETDTWSQGALSPSGIRDGGAVATSGVNAPKLIYVLGVIWNLWEGEPPYSVRVYDPVSDNWTFGANIPTERHNFGVAVVNDMLYVIGGQTFYYPDMQSWSAGPYVTTYPTNEQYTPFGYVTADPSSSPINTPPNAKTEPFPTTYIAIISGASISVVIISLLLFLRKRNHKAK